MRYLVSASALSLLLCLALVFSEGVSAQGDGHVPGMIVETDMSLTSIGDLEGSGSLVITFTGDNAREVRQHIMVEFDSDINQIIDREEAKRTLAALAATLEGRPYWGVTLSIANDFANVTSTEISDWVQNLVHEDWDSTDDLKFMMDIDCSGAGVSKVIFITDGAVNAFVDGFDDFVGYSFEGSMRISHHLSAIGVGSFTYPEIPNGTIQEVRTPAGTLLWYSCDFEVSGLTASSVENISYERFSILENQQVAFVLLLVGTLMIARMPHRRFENFRKLHPRRYRKYARPKNSVRISAIALLAVLWLLYLLPFVFSFAVDGFLIYSFYFILLVPVAVAGEHFISRYIYDKSALDIPEEAIIEVKQAFLEEEVEEGLVCSLCTKPLDLPEEVLVCAACGTQMHIECADRARACPSCGEILFPEDTRSIECKSCGESFLHTGRDDPYSIQCTRCGAFQEEVEGGKNYLVIDRDPTMAYRMIRAMGISGRPAMVMTGEFPGKTRSDFSLGEEVDVRWLSDATTDIDNVDPNDLEGDAMETSSTFLMTTKRAGLMIDGIAMLLELDGFERVLAFIRRLNDLAMIHDSSIIVSVDKAAMDEEHFKAFSDEFDEIHDYL